MRTEPHALVTTRSGPSLHADYKTSALLIPYPCFSAERTPQTECPSVGQLAEATRVANMSRARPVEPKTELRPRSQQITRRPCNTKNGLRVLEGNGTARYVVG